MHHGKHSVRMQLHYLVLRRASTLCAGNGKKDAEFLCLFNRNAGIYRNVPA